MRIDQLSAQHFRSLGQISLSFSTDFVLFQGDNGAGKTSLLEAISFLATGKSFLGTRPSHLIQHGRPELWVAGRVVEADQQTQLGISRANDGQLFAKINGERAGSLSALAHTLPFLVVGAEGLAWMAGTPMRRRSILDWGVFHVEGLSSSVYSGYRKALEQRNKALKNDMIAVSDVQVWDGVLAQYGEQIVASREAYLSRLCASFEGLASQVEGLPEIRLSHSPGYSRDKGDLAQALARGIARDRAMGSTYSGPHRGDLNITCRGAPALEVLSRGQQKVLVALLVLAQQELLWQVRQRKVVLLVDDLAAELDDQRQAHLWRLMTHSGAQVFLTSVDAQRVRPIVDSNRRLQVFHVKQGAVSQGEVT